MCCSWCYRFQKCPKMRYIKNVDINEEQIGHLPYVFTLEWNVVKKYYETYCNPIYASTVMPLLAQIILTIGFQCHLLGMFPWMCSYFLVGCCCYKSPFITRSSLFHDSFYSFITLAHYVVGVPSLPLVPIASLLKLQKGPKLL